MVPETIRNMINALSAAFCLIFILLIQKCSIEEACRVLYLCIISLVTIACILAVQLGLMTYWDIKLNAVSLVNLVMSVGLSIEYIMHIIREFHFNSGKTSFEKVYNSITTVGLSVFNGGCSTFLGIVLLVFVEFPVFEVYYFRMYFLCVVIGLLYSLAFLPAFLFLCGSLLSNNSSSNKNIFENPDTYKIAKGDEIIG